MSEMSGDGIDMDDITDSAHGADDVDLDDFSHKVLTPDDIVQEMCEIIREVSNIIQVRNGFSVFLGMGLWIPSILF